LIDLSVYYDLSLTNIFIALTIIKKHNEYFSSEEGITYMKHENVKNIFPILFVKYLSSFCRWEMSKWSPKIGESRCQFHQHFLREFLYKNASRSFSLITVWLCDFLVKGCWQKLVRKMLIKKTPGENTVFLLLLLIVSWLYFW